MYKFATGTALIIALSANALAPADPVCNRFHKSVSKGPSSRRLKLLYEIYWDYIVHEFPETATFTGFPGQDDRWTDLSPEAVERRKKVAPCGLAALRKVGRRGLKGDDAVNYDLMERRLLMQMESQKFPGEFLVLDHLSGLHTDLPETISAMPSSTMKNYQDRIARLNKVPDLEFQVEALLSGGLKRKVTPLKMFLERVPAQIEKVLTAKPEDSPLFASFKEIRAPLTEAEKQEIKRQALSSIKNQVYPALQKLRDFLVDTYIPGSRTTPAWKDMPDGKAWYTHLVKSHTTTSLTPQALHDLGLKEVARITAEMETLRGQVRFKGDLKAFNQFLLSDPQFYFTDTADLLRAYRDLAKRIDPELPRLFKTLPRLTYGVREIPAYKAKESPTAYYQSGSAAAGRAGYFEANTSDLKSRPKWAIEALTMHEAVPGHHLQIALAEEIKDQPEARKHEMYTAFVEGWGLYAESLAGELGFAKDPYSKYGQLSYEMWRAVRLVVDTGMHWLGWSREQAVQYFADHLPKTRFEAEQEVDRYLTWPGQALAYKVGQLKIQELREFSRRELGDRFDVREFHDQVLLRGALPLDVLERHIKDWVAGRKK